MKRLRQMAVALAALAMASLGHAAAPGSALYIIRYDHWTDSDERDYERFIASIGSSPCWSVNDCLHGPGNWFRASDPPDHYFDFDCADLAYVLRAYFAWKRGLPFSFESGVVPRGSSSDIRYSPDGNKVTARTDVLSGSMTGYQLLDLLRDTISTASFRMHPDIEGPLAQDFYSPAIKPGSIRPGTLIYDPTGHVAIVYEIEPDGLVRFFDGHPDNTVWHVFYDKRFARERPAAGAGFKNWRPVRLVGAVRRADGALTGGHMVLDTNNEISDFSDEQYYGNTQPKPADGNWKDGQFALNGETLDYYDYVRAKMAGGQLRYDPLKEVRQMVESNCGDLQYRAAAINLAIDAGIEKMAEPARLPPNIYGTDGAWEIYSTPSRDARLKTAFKELRDEAERFMTMYRAHDPKLVYAGNDLASDMLGAYEAQAALCKLSYTRSDGSVVNLTYQEAEKRLFLMSFDPYQCVELRWGAYDASELSTCADGKNKRLWYDAERPLRNQLDRTYEARMDFTRAELLEPGPGKGVDAPPGIDVRGYLESVGGVWRGAVASSGAGQ